MRKNLFVLGTSYSLEEYQKLPKNERLLMREKAFNSLIEYNRSCGYSATGYWTEGTSSRPQTDVRFPYEIYDVFLDWEKVVETPIEELERRIQGHDWTYMMSDDYSVWQSGNSNWNTIQRLVKELGQVGQEMLEKATPEYMKELEK